MCKNWLISVSEESGTRNATRDNGASLKQIYFRLNLFLMFQLLESIESTLNSNQYQIKICFKPFSISGMVLLLLNCQWRTDVRDSPYLEHT